MEWILIGFLIAVGMGLAYLAYLALLWLFLTEEGHGVLFLVFVVLVVAAAVWWW